MNADTLRIAAISIVVLAAGFVFAYQFVEPAPPDEITIATGGQKGAYYAYAKRYHRLLAHQGIKLNILETAGSLENIELLTSGEADVAFVQGGTGNREAQPGLISLGSLYFEPLWVFVREGVTIEKLSDLKGRTVAAGPEGSGTWAVTRQLLETNDVVLDTLDIRHLSSMAATRALIGGQADVAFFVTSPASPLVYDLLTRTDLKPLNFERAIAYTRKHRYLSAVTLHQGMISLGANIPPQDITLLAPAATLAARGDLHPALQTLMVQIASEVHGAGGFFEEPGQFPAGQYVDYPLSDDAKRYLQNGPSFLERYLPFWAADMADRLKVMLIPLITLLIPLAKVLPPVYRWRIRSRIYRWYKDLIRIEREVGQADTPEARRSLMEQLATMEHEVRALYVPLSYTDELYNLRMHIELVMRNLSDRPL